MTPSQFHKLRIAIGLTSQQDVADFLHRSLRTIHGWENGDPIDPLAIKLLRVMTDHKLSLSDVK